MATATLSRRKTKKQIINARLSRRSEAAHEPKTKQYVAFITYAHGTTCMSPWISKDLRDAKMIARDWLRDDSEVVSVQIVCVKKYCFDGVQVTMTRGS